MTTTMETITANGLKFTYLTEGKGPLVLLVHGFPDTPYTWDRVLPAIAKAGFRAVAPYTRGYLPTEIPRDGDYATDTLGRDILALIDALGEKQAIVVGHDWGAGAAYAAAALGPDKVKKLVTVAIPHPRALKLTPSLMWAGRHFISFRFPGAASRLKKNDSAMVDTLVRRWSPGWDFPPSETARVKETFRQPGSAEAAIGYYRAQTPRPTGALAMKIQVPTVTIGGDDLPAALYENAARCFTGGYQFVKLPGGHFLHREHPDAFEAALLKAIS
jgi:pimeloyl-ACP methyl ester carboxylesterase